MITVEVCREKQRWDEDILARGGHPLQLWGWGEVKAAHGWRVERVFVRDESRLLGDAQLFVRRLPWPFAAFVYVPRGPVTADEDREAVLGALADYAQRAHKAVALSIEPDWGEMPEVDGWRRSASTILIPRTLILNLAKTEDELLADMAKKTRQYIRKSGNEGLAIRKVRREELAACLEIYRQTAKRAGFALHGDRYYYDIFDMMGEYSQVFAAFYEGKPVAFLWLAVSREVAFELYGGMDDDGQRLRANYALKWHAITTIKRWGVAWYDFNGLLNDGVSTFKQGFSRHEDMLAGTYDRPLSPLYPLWKRAFPIAKRLVQKIKNR